MRRKVLVLFLLTLLLTLPACGSRRRRDTAAPPAPTSTSSPPAVGPTLPSATDTAVPIAVPTQPPVTATAQPPATPTLAPSPTTVPLARRRPITFNDYASEQTNTVETVCVVVNFSGKPERVFDLRQYWSKIFGQDDPIRQLNAYYRENYYGQLELQPVVTPQMGERGYIEVELPGVPQDYTFGWLIGLESEEMEEVDIDAVQRLLLDVMARVVEKHPEVNLQDKFMFIVLNAFGAEYGRGAAGALPTGGVEPTYDMFVGDVGQGELSSYADPQYFRTAGDKVIGMIAAEGYTFDDYFRDREAQFMDDQFVLGIALFSRDAPLSCASHDILHGLRRLSAYADPPEGRCRAVNCLYNLPMQSLWLVGTPDHGRCDRSINCTPYVGWWDPIGDHLHPNVPRGFFDGHPHGTSAFTKLRMGFIPDRCLAVADEDDVTIQLAPLSAPQLPAPGSEAEAIAIQVPLAPGQPTLEHIYLLLEYRRRVGSEAGEEHPDNFRVDPDSLFGDKRFDPGYDTADPAASQYINPPMVFVPDEGVLVYLVNEGMPELPGLPYSEWYNFVLALLNPEGNEKRDNLNNVALDAGERIEVDFQSLYKDRGVPVKLHIAIEDRTNDFATVHITREYLR